MQDYREISNFVKSVENVILNAVKNLGFVHLDILHFISFIQNDIIQIFANNLSRVPRFILR